MGLAQDLPFADYNGVGGNDDVVRLVRNSLCFPQADPFHFLLGGPGIVHGFVNICHPDGKGKMKQAHQFFTPGGLRG